jgi:hypothetical protein
MKPKPCHVCEDVIQKTVDGYKDPKVLDDEDDLNFLVDPFFDQYDYEDVLYNNKDEKEYY